FEVKLQLDRRPLSFVMHFDRGQKPKHDPPPALLPFVASHFLKLLVFNVELPQELLDRGKSKADDPIDAFFQIYLFRDIDQALEEIWNRKTQDKSALGEKGLTQRRNRVDTLKTKVRKLEAARAQAIHERDNLT